MWVIAVVPEYEKNDIGAKLFNRVEDWLWAEGWDQIWLTTDVNKLFGNAKHWSLETPEENTGNIHFYEKMGFSITERYLDGNVRVVLLERFNQ